MSASRAEMQKISQTAVGRNPLVIKNIISGGYNVLYLLICQFVFFPESQHGIQGHWRGHHNMNIAEFVNMLIDMYGIPDKNIINIDETNAPFSVNLSTTCTKTSSKTVGAKQANTSK